MLGDLEFDGFGQSVDLSADGGVLAVGANQVCADGLLAILVLWLTFLHSISQPPPGKTGYVNVYELEGSDGDREWKLVGDRIDSFSKKEISDVGRSVGLSSDGQTLLILGSVSVDNGDSSFMRVMRKDSDKWAIVGDDIKSSISYDDWGTSAHAVLSRDGKTVVITGSYSQFLAKLYEFDETLSKWNETIVPPLSCNSTSMDGDEDGATDDYYYYGFDLSYGCYFTGEGVSVNSDASAIAVVGTSYTSSGGEVATVRVVQKNSTTGNYTLIQDPIDFDADQYISSVDISGDGQKLAVGIKEDTNGRGTSISFNLDKEGKWVRNGQANGLNETDLLGARVQVTDDGKLAAASSRRGYIQFFP